MNDTDVERITRSGRNETPPQQSRRTHDDIPRERAARNRWRFSSAVEAARHLGSGR